MLRRRYQRLAPLVIVLGAFVLICAPFAGGGSTRAAAQSPPATEAPTRAATDGQEPARSAPVAPSPIALKLPKDLSPWGMFRSADIVVKLVMAGLAFASFLTATLAIAKALELVTANHALALGLIDLEKATSLEDADRQLPPNSAAADAVAAALSELRASSDTINSDGIKERVASRLQRLEARAARAMLRGTGLLATIGATAPFVGLFGTVWGIMNAFIGISKSQTTNLAVVAPGIAEALLATALGLVVAIPAVVIYNMFSRAIASYRAMLADATAATLRLASHDVDRSMSPSSPAKQPVSRHGAIS